MTATPDRPQTPDAQPAVQVTEVREDEGMTLTEFLTARLNEDEAAAQEIARYAQDAPLKAMLSLTEGDTTVTKTLDVYSPERALGEVAAKRRIIDNAVDPGDDIFLRILAAVYSDHPDCQEDWRA